MCSRLQISDFRFPLPSSPFILIFFLHPVLFPPFYPSSSPHLLNLYIFLFAVFGIGLATNSHIWMGHELIHMSASRTQEKRNFQPSAPLPPSLLSLGLPTSLHLLNSYFSCLLFWERSISSVYFFFRALKTLWCLFFLVFFFFQSSISSAYFFFVLWEL